MATEPERTTGLTYSQLLEMLRDEQEGRLELIDGEVVVTAAPLKRHERVVLEIGAALLAYRKTRGGEAYASPVDAYVSETNVLQPDAMYVAPDQVDPDERLVTAATLVVEVSSPSTRGRDLGRKKELYEQLGVPEYWFVDLDADRIEVYRLEGKRYGDPSFAHPGGRLTSPNLPGFELEVASALRGLRRDPRPPTTLATPGRKTRVLCSCPKEWRG